MRIIVAACLGLVLFFSSPRAQEAVPSGYPADYAKIVEASKSESGILVYSIMAAFNWAPVLESFKKKYPWIKVETLDMSSELWDRYYTEVSTNARSADVIATLDPNRWVEFSEKNEVMAYESPEAKSLPDWAKTLPGVYAMSADPALIIWNKRLVPSGTKLDSMKAVAVFVAEQGPKIKGRIASYDAEAGPSAGVLPFVWTEIQGEEGWKTLATIMPNAKFERTGGALLEKVTSGEYVVAYLVSAITAYTRLKEPARREVVDWSYMKDGQPLYVRGICVTKRARSPNSAKLLLDHVLSQQGQIGFAQGGMTPVRSDIDPTAIPNPTIPKLAELLGGNDKLGYRALTRENADRYPGFMEKWRKIRASER